MKACICVHMYISVKEDILRNNKQTSPIFGLFGNSQDSDCNKGFHKALAIHY